MIYRFFIALILISSSLYSASSLLNIKTFKANFVQNITNSFKTIEYKGEVFVKDSGKILWKYKMPIIKNVYILNKFAIIDEPQLEQAIFTQLENEINIIKLLQKAKKITKNIYETNIYDTKYQITFKNNKISQISYQDHLENKVLITFLKFEKDVLIEDELFVFKAPSYYDIIRK